MAAPNRILALDLGTQVIGLAEFRTGQGGGLVLSNYATTELMADPAADATRQAQAKLAISELVGNHGYKGARVNYSVASQAVFTRFVKLPSVGEEQVDAIVAFEAQQNVPFPINEVVWDYQLVDSGDSSVVEVVIVAIKSDLLDEMNASVEESGMQAATVDVAPMALYNAFRYNYSDLPGCSLIIDIGARTTNLVFIEPRKVFSRNITTGGNTITAAVAKDFNEPFIAAEDRKKRDGFVSLGGAYAEPDDPEVARVSKMVRNTMTRLHAEIARSITFYRSQQGGSQPQRVFLAGGSASMPYMREFFQEKFQVPVEFFNPLRNVTIADNLNLDEIGRQAHTMGELVGLALRGVSSCPMEFNLRPASVVARQRLAERQPAFILAGVCLLLALAAFWLYFDRSAKNTALVTEAISPRVSELKSFEDRMTAAKRDIANQQEIAKPLLAAVNDRQYWARIIDDINARLPKEYIWITVLEPQVVQPTPAAGSGSRSKSSSAKKPAVQEEPQTVLNVRGLYLESERGTQPVDQFWDSLSKSELYKVDENPATRIRETPNSETWAYAYGMRLILNSPIELPAPATRK